MADNTSGVNGPNRPIQKPVNKAKMEAVGEQADQSVKRHSPKGSGINRTPSQTENTSLKGRKVVAHKQTRSIQSHDVTTIRHVPLTGQWSGVASAFKVHVANEEQLNQLLHDLGSEIDFPAEIQDAICNKFSAHSATRTAGILVSNLSPREAHGSLLLIIDCPERHDRPR